MNLPTDTNSSEFEHIKNETKATKKLLLKKTTNIANDVPAKSSDYSSKADSSKNTKVILSKPNVENEKKSNTTSWTNKLKLSAITEIFSKEHNSTNLEQPENKNITSRVLLTNHSKIKNNNPTTNIYQTTSTPIPLKRAIVNTPTNNMSLPTSKVKLVGPVTGKSNTSSSTLEPIDPDAKKILIVDDELSILKVLEHIFRTNGYIPSTCSSGEEALEMMKHTKFNLVITDLRLSDQMDGLDLMHAIKPKYPNVPIVIITGYASVKIAIQALKEGAFDLVTKPFRMEQLIEVVKNAIDFNDGHSIDKIVSQDVKLHFGLIIGEDPKMKNIYNLVKRIAKTDATILINGEPGTEKDTLATIVQFCSRRSDLPFIKLNCKLLSQPHVDISLIGNIAIKANNGTLYLQNIHLLSLEGQQEVFRLLNEQSFQGNQLNFRFITSTEIPLKKLLETQNFSRELYYKMCAFTIDLPPLRQRVEDIPLLINYYIFKHSEEKGIDLKISDEAMNILLNYSWPNNTEELEKVFIESCEACKNNIINPEDLPKSLSSNNNTTSINKNNMVGKAAREYLQQQVSSKSQTENIALKIRQQNK
ncbi:MAG: sigma-54-dependent transcriptional regulator [Lentisphaeria bacterium]